MSMLPTILPDLLHAAITTALLTLATLVLATILAVPLAVIRARRGMAARIAAAYTTLMRAVPTLVVLFLVYYGLPAFGITVPAVPAAVAGLVVSATAYIAEIVRAGLAAVPPGQGDAARALGLRPLVVLWQVTVPQALPVIVPTWIANAAEILKGSSIVSLITVPELTARANDLVAETFRPTAVLLTTSAIYVAMGGAITLAGVAAQHRMRGWARS